MEPAKPQKTVIKIGPDIDPKMQAELNKPPVDKTGFNPGDEEFLKQVMEMVENGKINLYSPSSLINQPVYERLTTEQKGKADFDAVNLLTTLRNIYNLWQIAKEPTFQIQNMVGQVRATKERLEGISGDIYII